VEITQLEERYMRAREIYLAISKLMAHSPRKKEQRLREMAIIRAAVVAGGFSWEEVLLAGLTVDVGEWQKELASFTVSDDSPAVSQRMPVHFDPRTETVSLLEISPEFGAGCCHVSSLP